jgi:hypothetical protein
MRPEYGLVPEPIGWKGKRALLCQVRPQYGIYALDAYEEVARAQAVVDTLLFGRIPRRQVSILGYLYPTSIRRLASKGVQFITLS